MPTGEVVALRTPRLAAKARTFRRRNLAPTGWAPKREFFAVLPQRILAAELLWGGAHGLWKLCRVAGMVGLAAAGRRWLRWRRRRDARAGRAWPGRSGAPDAGPAVDPSVDGQLTINELMPDNVLTIRDDRGAASPWIEIYNPTAQDIALGRLRHHRRFRRARKGDPPGGRRRARRAATSSCGPTATPRPGRRISACCCRMRVDHWRWRAPTARSSIGSPTARRRPTSPRRASRTARGAGSASGTCRPVRRTRPARGSRFHRRPPAIRRRRCRRPAT